MKYWLLIVITLLLTTATPSGAVELHWVSDSESPEAAFVQVSGFSEQEWSRLDAGIDWKELLEVRAEAEGLQIRPDLPAMLGRYEMGEKTLRFVPRFPLIAGLRYSAVLRTTRMSGTDKTHPLSASYRFESVPNKVATRVTAIHPTASVLPMNLLKVYLHFSAPMSRGSVHEHVRVLDDKGAVLELAFLELAEELWNAEQTRLTLLFDPGRIKRGLLPRDQEGPVFEAGKSYTLEVNAAWKDGAGTPLHEVFRKTFQVSAPDKTAPDPARWHVIPPPAGSLQPLVVRFDEPLDSALARRLIWVETAAGTPLEGEEDLTDEDCRWQWTPAHPWPGGGGVVRVLPLIEDLAGNQIGKVFDVDVFDNQTPARQGPRLALKFSFK